MQRDIVIGPPGCGKTSYIARQIEQAVVSGARPVVMSLTRAAAVEAASRGLPVDKESVGTLHALALRALGRPQLAQSAKWLKEWNEEYPELKLSIDAHDIGEHNVVAQKVSNSFGQRCMEEWGKARHRMEPMPRVAKHFVERWNAWKAENHLMDWTDLLENALEDTFWAPGQPSVIFVDEAQDLSKLELALVEKWGNEAGRLVTVGDPWQNLFAWRGSDADAFTISHDGATRVLKQSYRVPKAIHGFVVRFMKGMPGYEPIEYFPTDVEGEVLRGGSRWKSPHRTLDAVVSDADTGKTVMMLAPTEYMLRPVIKEMRQRGIPFHNPYRTKSAEWNPLGARRGVSTVERIKAFLRPTASSWMNWIEDDIAKWTQLTSVKSTIQSGGRKGIDGLEDDILAAEGVLTTEAMNAVHGGNLEWLHENALKTKKPAMEYPIRVVEARGADALSETPKIMVGSIHSVKGGEADSVYLWHDMSPAGMQEWMFGDRASVYRMFYVAMTRAREKLTICPTESNYAGGI